MRCIRKKGWQLPESFVTDEAVFLNRRRFMRGAALVAGAGLVGGGLSGCGSEQEDTVEDTGSAADPSAGRYPVTRNDTYEVSREITSEETATTYNNFYEFGSSKRISSAAQALPIRPGKSLSRARSKNPSRSASTSCWEDAAGGAGVPPALC